MSPSGTKGLNLVRLPAMFNPVNAQSDVRVALDPLDRVAILYLVLPVGIFLLGWFEWWVSVPLLACIGYALRPLAAAASRDESRFPLNGTQLVVALTVGCAWSVLGGTEHLFFANADWHTRDAVLHDLVVSPWPVSYGLLDGNESLLRAPLAYYMPAALIGKMAGLAAAHFSMLLWTATGSTLFLLQVVSLAPPRVATTLMVCAVIVLFSGFDIIGSLLNEGPRFRSDWNITQHLEWWAGSYQYSSMTTQLFWVPNHALGGWVMIGLLYRSSGTAALDEVLPMLMAVVTLWSPLTAIGLVPFVGWQLASGMIRRRSLDLLRPQIVVPTLAVGLALAAYLVLDMNRIPKGMALQNGGAAGVLHAASRHAQFFLLEAGLVGLAIAVIRRSSELLLALSVLALLPLAYFGSANDFVMRASIPSLTILAISSSMALLHRSNGARYVGKKILLGCLLAIGAVTPIEEIARAIVLPAWPIDLRTTVIGADCGRYPPNYVARLGGEAVVRLLRRPVRIPLGSPRPTRRC